MNKCQYCGKETDNPYMYTAMSLIIPEWEEKIDKWGRENWWENLERKDITLEEAKELDDLTFYDQLVSTVGKGYACTPCLEKDDKNYLKYYHKK